MKINIFFFYVTYVIPFLIFIMIILWFFLRVIRERHKLQRTVDYFRNSVYKRNQAFMDETHLVLKSLKGDVDHPDYLTKTRQLCWDILNHIIEKYAYLSTDMPYEKERMYRRVVSIIQNFSDTLNGELSTNQKHRIYKHHQACLDLIQNPIILNYIEFHIFQKGEQQLSPILNNYHDLTEKLNMIDSTSCLLNERFYKLFDKVNDQSRLVKDGVVYSEHQVQTAFEFFEKGFKVGLE